MTSDEYARWLDKFNARHTSDDTFTPPPVYDAVLDYVRERYGIDGDRVIVRPFYPGGDFEHHEYPDGCVVVDNPPFSIMSKIIKTYNDMAVDYFLFAPGNVLPGAKAVHLTTYLSTNLKITYDNGAEIMTSFVTSLEPGVAIRSAPEIVERVQPICDRLKRDKKRKVIKNDFPDELLTAAMVGYMSCYGVDFALMRDESELVSKLDAMRDTGKGIYGKGFLMSKAAAAKANAAKVAAAKAAAAKAAAAKAAAGNVYKWALSKRELDIVEKLGGDNVREEG